MRLQYCVFRSQRSASDYYPPGITIGRLSAMHGIAGFGAALVLVSIFSLLVDPLPQRFRIESGISLFSGLYA